MAEKKTSKGGGKGGTHFPRFRLEEAAVYAEKLVSKTHTGPQPEAIIYPGVFGASGWRGRTRASAMKQYGLMEGTSKDLKATQEAKDFVATPKDERRPLLQKACLKPKLFKMLFDTFQDDKVSRARVRQQVLKFEVHPDYADKCVSVFIESVVYASLATQEGDDIDFGQHPAIQDDPEVEGDGSEEIDEQGDGKGDDTSERPGGGRNPKKDRTRHERRSKAQVQINIDPSMDPEKLEKLLKVLSDYGQI